MRSHPKNLSIRTCRAARMLIFFTRHWVLVLTRLLMDFLGCDIGLRLPNMSNPSA